MEPLSTPSGPVGLDVSRILPEASAFKVLKTGGFWSRADYVVNHSDGSRVMKANHKTLSSRRGAHFTVTQTATDTDNTAEVTDQNGLAIFKMRMSKIKQPIAFYLEREDGSQLAEIKGKWNLTKFNADLKITNLNGEPATLELRDHGGLTNDKFDITYEGQVVARISRHEYNRQVSKEQGVSQWYDVNVAANIDATLVCLFERLLGQHTLISKADFCSDHGAR